MVGVVRIVGLGWITGGPYIFVIVAGKGEKMPSRQHVVSLMRDRGPIDFIAEIILTRRDPKLLLCGKVESTP